MCAVKSCALLYTAVCDAIKGKPLTLVQFKKWQMTLDGFSPSFASLLLESERPPNKKLRGLGYLRPYSLQTGSLIRCCMPQISFTQEFLIFTVRAWRRYLRTKSSRSCQISNARSSPSTRSFTSMLFSCTTGGQESQRTSRVLKAEFPTAKNPEFRTVQIQPLWTRTVFNHGLKWKQLFITSKSPATSVCPLWWTRVVPFPLKLYQMLQQQKGSFTPLLKIFQIARARQCGFGWTATGVTSQSFPQYTLLSGYQTDIFLGLIIAFQGNNIWH